MDSTSLVILDLKEIDAEKHQKLTGHSNENILAMARYVADLACRCGSAMCWCPA